MSVPKPLKALPSMSSPILSKASNHQNHPPSLSPISRSLNIGRSSTDPLSPKTPTRSTCPDQDLSLNLDDAEADLNITAESSFGGATFGDEDGMSEERQPKHTPHNWPTWLTDLKRDFGVLIVNKCWENKKSSWQKWENSGMNCDPWISLEYVQIFGNLWLSRVQTLPCPGSTCPP